MAASLRGLIFDMDGVLVDSHALHRTAWRRFFRTLGREIPDRELDFILDGRKRREILLHFLGPCPEPELERLGRCKDELFRQMQVSPAPVPGAVQTVRELSACKLTLAVATSASRERALSTLAQLEMLDCFQAIVTGEDVRFGKPDSAIYRLACDRVGIDPGNLLAVEDAISGVHAAVGAGLRCLGVALHEDPGRLAAAGAAYVVKNFEGIGVEELKRMMKPAEA
ncbi:MAG TPA: HAD family phosphatase [Candidatus Binatia bacterium]|nr:HAD family phosphatase [Candidatus Binatia bacterium]